MLSSLTDTILLRFDITLSCLSSFQGSWIRYELTALLSGGRSRLFKGALQYYYPIHELWRPEIFSNTKDIIQQTNQRFFGMLISWRSA